MTCLVAQLTYFYTEKVGLAAGAVATMLLIAKIADAFSDLIMGKIMDKLNSPEGKCRPWFKWMIAPTAAVIVLMFTVPKMPSGIQLAYVLITNILVSAVVYTAIAIPYGAMVNNCVEFNEWKFGKRLLGMSNSASSFGAKVGSGIGGSLIGWLLAAAGYQAAAASQPASVNTAIFAFAIYIPLALFIIMAILFSKYDLEKIYPKIVEELKVRRAAKNAQ